MSHYYLLVACWCIYGRSTPPDDVLDRMGEILGKLEEMYEGDDIFIRPFSTKPDGLDAEKVKWVRSRMQEAGFSRASLSCS